MDKSKTRIVSSQTSCISSRLSKRLREHKRKADNGDTFSIDNIKQLKTCETISKCNSSGKLKYNFFNKNCIVLAKSLLGKLLVRRLHSGEILKGRIVETECYLGFEDEASHSYNGRRTVRNEAIYAPPSTSYVYSIHGKYFCFNIINGEAAGVLLRALEPVQGMSTMERFRLENRKVDIVLKPKDFCNGPSKLCQAFKINKQEHNKIDLCESEELWLENGFDVNDVDIISCHRIGISSAGKEWANKPFRFYIKNCDFVSVKNNEDKK